MLVGRFALGGMLAGVVVRQDEMLSEPECVEAEFVGRDREVQ